MKGCIKFLLAFAVVSLATIGVTHAQIAGTAHDLTASYSVNGATSTDLCRFCHAPHVAAADTSLWDRNNPVQGDFTLYDSLTLATANRTPTLGSQSLGCLSCHDGVTAYGDVAAASSAGDDVMLPAAAGFIGRNLEADHPVGVTITAAQSEMFTISSIVTTNGVPLYGGSGDSVECASCHAVHDDTNSPFLRRANSQTLCIVCHNK